MKYNFIDRVELTHKREGVIVGLEANSVLPYEVAIDKEEHSTWVAEDDIVGKIGVWGENSIKNANNEVPDHDCKEESCKVCLDYLGEEKI